MYLKGNTANSLTVGQFCHNEYLHKNDCVAQLNELDQIKQTRIFNNSINKRAVTNKAEIKTVFHQILHIHCYLYKLELGNINLTQNIYFKSMMG